MTYPRFALRRLFRVVNGGTPGPQLANWEGEVPWATPVDLGANGAFISSTSRSLTILGAVTGSRVVAAGSLLLSTRAPIGYVAIAAVDMAFNQGCKALVPQQELDARYFYYQLVARSADLQAAGRGSTFMELPNEGLAALDVSAPTLEEQRRVADFLDDQVAALERKVTILARASRLIDDRAEALISGEISPYLSGAGRLPMFPMRRLLRKLARPIGPGDNQMITAFRDGQVIARAARRTDGFTDSWTEDSAVQGVHTGDVVIHGLDGFSGAVGTSESTGVCSPANHVCRPLDGGDADFYGRMLRMLALSGYLSLFGGSARERAVDFRNWRNFSSTLLPTVSPSRQVHVGEVLRSARHLRSPLDRHRRLVQERMHALITAAVTGEFDVSTASARSVA